MKINLGVFPSLVLLSLLCSGCHLDILDARKDGLIAGFTYSVIEGKDGVVPVTLKFENTSAEAISYIWDFGDGAQTSTDFNPSHRYTKAGDYSVSLLATNADGETDEFISPISLEAGTFVLAGLPLTGEVIVNNIVQVSDSSYQVLGSLADGSLRKQLLVSLDVIGDTTQTTISSPYSTMPINSSLYAIVPYLLQETYPPTQVYTVEGELNLFYAYSFDVFAVNSFPEFGSLQHVVLTEDGHLVLIGDAPSIGIDWMTVLNRNNPQPQLTLSSLYSTEDAVASDGSGVAVLASRSRNSEEEQVRFYTYDTNGELMSTNILFPSTPKTNWILANGQDNGYSVFGSLVDSILHVSLTANGERLGEQWLDADFTFVSDVVTLEDGSFVILGSEPSTGQRPPGIGVRKYSQDGGQVWHYHYNADFVLEETFPQQIITTQDCGFLIRAFSDPLTQATAPVIIKLNENGRVE